MRMQRNTSIRCTTSTCALPMINSERLDRDWYEGIVQKLKWNVPIRAETSEGPPPLAPSRQAQKNHVHGGAGNDIAEQAAKHERGSTSSKEKIVN